VLWKLWVTRVCEPQAARRVWDSHAAMSRRDSNALLPGPPTPQTFGQHRTYGGERLSSKSPRPAHLDTRR